MDWTGRVKFRLKMEMSAEMTYGGSSTANGGTLGASGLETTMCEIAVKNGNDHEGDIRGKRHRKWRNTGCSESRAMSQIEGVEYKCGHGSYTFRVASSRWPITGRESSGCFTQLEVEIFQIAVSTTRKKCSDDVRKQR